MHFRNILYYLESVIFSSIFSLKNEIEDKLNQNNQDFYRWLIDLPTRTNKWIFVEPTLIEY